jgi:bifunctional non-homologous end joining protein LigD
VVQRHRARRLHYDFRLEIDGVLASWAVPKGPTLDPGIRRAAFHVEDHPLEYFDFEGVIPAGGYGGGDVIVWDEGTWEPDEAGDPPDPGQAVRDGQLHLDMYGHKLRGRFVLIRTRTGADGKEEWLLLHKHDDHALDGWDPEQHPRSVLSGRTNDEVKADPDRLWRSDMPADQASVDLKPDGDPGAPAKAAVAPNGEAAPSAKPRAKAAPSATPRAAVASKGKAAVPPERRVPSGPSPEELGQLDALGPGGTWDVWGREVQVTNLDKVLFPARPGSEPVTKRAFLRYAAQIAPVALPYLAHRALNMHRFPNGADAKGFWHKELPGHAPEWVPRWEDPEATRGERRTYLVVGEPAALVWAANFGALEWHAWTSRTDHPLLPTYALIDLDPGDRTSWDDLLVLARLHRTALEHLGVLGQPKLTGRRGIQIWIPISPGPAFAETREWAEKLSRVIGAVAPNLVSWKWQVSERGGLARLDYTQNALNKTLVAPYSPRPAPGAPVSAPIEWDELDDPDLVPDRFTITSVLARIQDKGDLFAPVLGGDQRLPPFDAGAR